MVSIGYVGNNTISSVLQMGCNDIVIVPTVLYSNHLGHSTVGGFKISEDLLTAVLNGILELGIIKEITTIITGFIGSAEQVKIIANFVRTIKILKPEIRYLCDPVMGDIDKGQYVEPDVPNALVKYLVPLADFLTPNQYEIETIIGKQINTAEDVPRLLKGQFNLNKQKIDLHPPGTGDMFTAYLCLLMQRGMKLSDAIKLSGNIISKVLINMLKGKRIEFELQDILYSINILQTMNYNSSTEIKTI